LEEGQQPGEKQLEGKKNNMKKERKKEDYKVRNGHGEDELKDS